MPFTVRLSVSAVSKSVPGFGGAAFASVFCLALMPLVRFTIVALLVLPAELARLFEDDQFAESDIVR
jgi:hypothetical protein